MLNGIATVSPVFDFIFASFMQQVHNKIRGSIFAVLDFFYPLFRNFLPLQTYHYAACGGVNTLLSLFLYSFSYNFIFDKQLVHVGPFVFEPYIAALFVSFIITLPIGFYLSMYVTFQGSLLRRGVQFFRYFIVIIGCMLINYVCLKLFVGVLHWFPTPSQMLTTAVVILFNYFSQRHFSFKTATQSAGK